MSEKNNETVTNVSDKTETAQAAVENQPADVPSENSAGAANKKEDKKEKDKKAVKLLEKQLEDLRKEQEKLVEQKDSINDTYLRMLAEYDNFRKRVQKEKETLYADGIAEAVEKLLPVLDNLERAVATDPASSDTQSVLAGVQKVLDQAQEVFGKLGVSEIPAKGEKFNPEIHNAVMHEESEDYEENTISDVFMKGYKLGDKVIRHSVVKVMN